jgi:hypothetical protein
MRIEPGQHGMSARRSPTESGRPRTQVLTQPGTTGTPLNKGGTGLLANSGRTAVVWEDLHSPVGSGSQAGPWACNPRASHCGTRTCGSDSEWSVGRCSTGTALLSPREGTRPGFYYNFLAGLATALDTAGPERIARGTLRLHRSPPPLADGGPCP